MVGILKFKTVSFQAFNLFSNTHFARDAFLVGIVTALLGIGIEIFY